MNKILEAAIASTKYEKINSELKKEYIKENINLINSIFRLLPGFKGSFGTGYPFYALGSSLNGNLPVIEEQLRYNDELYREGMNEDTWTCENCLCCQGRDMPDLKQYCKPCPKIKDSIKPRKVINRLPDIDMWMICDDECVDKAKEILIKYLELHKLQTSDVDPIQTIEDVKEVANDLENGVMPKKKLPLDIHIVKESEFKSLLTILPFKLIDAFNNKSIPYLPIHPISLRKTWQYDDEAYNFVLDYFLSLTPFYMDDSIVSINNVTKQLITSSISNEDLYKVIDMVSPETVKRRMDTMQLRKNYESRIDSWRR